MKNWNKYLKLLGLNESEIAVFLSVLQSGPETVQNIAKSVNLSRVTVYSVINSLIKHGLMTSVEKGKKTYYTAEPPERIITLAESRTAQMATMIKEIKENIQELKLVQSGNKPVVKMYEGIDAFTAIQDDVVATKTNRICEFGNIDVIDKLYPYGDDARKKYFGKLAAKPAERQLIYLSKTKKPRTQEPNKKIKYLSDEVDFNGDIFFYGDTVWLSNFRDKQLAVMIKDQELKNTIQAMFDLIWEKLP